MGHRRYFDKCFNIAVPNLARFDVTGHIDSSWKPKPNDAVHSLLVEGADLYAGGEFTTFGRAPNLYAAKYLVRVPVLEPDAAWQPQPDQAVFAMATDGSYLFAGGRFTKMARAKRQYLAQIPLSGLHTQIANYVWPKLARFNRASLALDTTFHSTGEQRGLVRAIAPQAYGSLFIGGSFDGWDNDYAKNTFVRIVPNGGAPQPLLQLPRPPMIPRWNSRSPTSRRRPRR